MAQELSVAGTALRWASPLALLWLAFFFGRTLRSGEALIERIALRSQPQLPQALRRYTRRLTAFWCAYLVLAAALSAAANWLHLLAPLPVQVAIVAGTLLLFVGERAVRPWWFPGESFPGLLQQLRDTAHVWRAPR